jgi:hypothetical protein
MTPLRQRMIEDMSIRQFGPKTQQDYVRVVADFARFLGRSPDQAEPEDLRRYQLHLAAEGASPAKMNAAISAPTTPKPPGSPRATATQAAPASAHDPRHGSGPNRPSPGPSRNPHSSTKHHQPLPADRGFPP